MIVDSTQEFPNLDDVDVCVVGGGAAGITLAVELAKFKKRVVMLEEGGTVAEGSNRSAYKVTPGSEVTLGLADEMKLFLGGNTNYWHGNCRPLDRMDFEARDYIPYSGWPIPWEELLPYYDRAQALLGLGGFAWYDVEAAKSYLTAKSIIPLESSVLETRIEHTTPTFSLSDLYLQTLAEESNIIVLLGCHAKRLTGNRAADKAVTVEVIRGDSAPVSVAAERFVIACGGIDNARILLSSNDILQGGASKVSDLVGRYFQEHWYYSFKTKLIHRTLFGKSRSLRLYDVGSGDREAAFREYRWDVGNSRVWGQLVLAKAVQREKRLPGLAVWFSPGAIDVPSGIRALKAAISQPGSLPRALLETLRHPLSAAVYIGRKLMRRARCLELIAEVEQLPDPANRIIVSPTNGDQDEPNVSLEVGLDADQRRSHAEALKLAANELGLDGQRLAAEMERKYSVGDFGFYWHHMGTTRMSDERSDGVVNRNCQVHGVKNLFVAGSSVFPTTGTAAPTLTIIALAIRLADHLAGGRNRD